jgi:hypothetical protein
MALDERFPYFGVEPTNLRRALFYGDLCLLVLIPVCGCPLYAYQLIGIVDLEENGSDNFIGQVGNCINV